MLVLLLTTFDELYIVFFPTDENNIGSDSDIDLQDEDAAEARTEHALALSQRSEETPWSRSALSKGNDNQDATKERTSFRTTDDMCSVEIDSARKRLSEMVSQGSSSLGAAHLQTLDFSSAASQQFLKLGAPLLFHPGQLPAKPEAFSSAGVGHLFSSLPGVNNQENRGLSSQSLPPPSPFIFHLSQHMLASQVCTLNLYYKEDVGCIHRHNQERILSQRHLPRL